MDKINKLPEVNKKVVHQYVLDYIASEEAKNKNIMHMMSNTDYINWLIQFTQDNNGFSDDSWLYTPEEINDNDRENVENLALFYEGICNYASQNYYYPTPCQFGNYYKVRLAEIGFEIGIMVGQGTIFFCKKVVVENEQDFIDFNDIIAGKTTARTEQINNDLNSLSNMILTIYANGVPRGAIVQSLENAIKTISKEEDKGQVLIKK